jgi:hypothetical protein
MTATEELRGPAYMMFTICVQRDNAEAMLFMALCKIVRHFDFTDLDYAAKARCAQHLADMLADKDIPR